MPPRDSGASPERTRLAWRRTSLVLTVVAVLIARLGMHHRNIFITALAGLCWAGLLAVIQRRVRALSGPAPLRDTRLLLVMAAGSIAFGVMGAALVLRGH